MSSAIASLKFTRPDSSTIVSSSVFCLAIAEQKMYRERFRVPDFQSGLDTNLVSAIASFKFTRPDSSTIVSSSVFCLAIAEQKMYRERL